MRPARLPLLRSWDDVTTPSLLAERRTARVTRWQKLGLIFRPDAGKWWMRSHASLPVPLQLQGSFYRVYFASREVSNVW